MIKLASNGGHSPRYLVAPRSRARPQVAVGVGGHSLVAARLVVVDDHILQRVAGG